MAPPPGHTLYVGDFAALEVRFLDEIRALKAFDPLRPVDVLVGSNLLGVYLRRRAAETFGGIANLRFLTFLDLARERLRKPDPRPPLPPLGEALLARRAILETPEGDVFEVLRERPSTAALLVRTAADLRGAGIAASRLVELLPAASRTPDRAEFLRKVAAVLARFEELRSAFSDPDSLLARAATSTVPSRPDPLLVYGLYDLGGVREALLSAVAAGRPVDAFVPVDGEAEETGDGIPPVRAVLFSRILGAVPCALPRTAVESAVSVVVAPSEQSEAREVVREILRAVDEGVPLHRIAVLVRDPSRQEPALVAELSLRRIPFFRPAGAGFSRTPIARAAIGLVELPSSGFAPDALLSLVDVLEGLALVAPGARARVARALVELRAKEDWKDLKRRLDARLGHAAPAEPAEAEGRHSRRDAKVRLDLAALRCVVDLLSPVLPDTAPASWSAWAGRIAASGDALLGHLASAGEIALAAARIDELEAVDPAASVAASELLPLLTEALEETPVRQGRFERDGVSLLTHVSARGLLFDVVLVPGLVEQSFPRAGRPDPLLFDDERKAVAAKAKVFLAPRTGRRHAREERFLFQLALGAARHRLVLLAARREAATDRPRLLSPFLLDLLEKRAGSAVSEASLSDPVKAAALGVRWIRLGRPATSEAPVDGDEALRTALARAPRLAAALPPGLEPLARALRRGQARAEARYTEYEGRLRRAPRALLFDGRIVSPSRLERLSACGYRAFLVEALGLSAPEEPPGELVLDSRTIGELAHAALDSIAKEAIRTGRTFADVLRARGDAEAERELRTFLASWEIDLPPVLAEAAAARLSALLRAVAGLEAARGQPLPLAGTEVRFGPSAGLEVTAGDGCARASLAGRIDRLDRNGEIARVVDYKFANPKPFGKTNRKGWRIVGGEKVQLAAYALAARSLGATEVSSEYLFVSPGKKGGPPEAVSVTFDAAATEEAVASFHHAVGLLDTAVREGDLLPRTASLSSGASLCSYCDVAAVCGPGHRRVYDAKREAEAVARPDAPLFALAEIP